MVSIKLTIILVESAVDWSEGRRLSKTMKDIVIFSTEDFAGRAVEQVQAR